MRLSSANPQIIGGGFEWRTKITNIYLLGEDDEDAEPEAGRP